MRYRLGLQFPLLCDSSFETARRYGVYQSDDEEGPQRPVTIRRPFAIGRFEVTFAEWDACVSAGSCRRNPRDSGWGRGRQPVIDVPWQEAREYAAWLTRNTGKSYRLLTEA